MADYDYSITHLFESVTDSNSALLRVKTNGNGIRGIIPVTSAGKCKIELQTGTTFSSNGTDESVYERNEKDIRTTTVDASYSPTVDSSGEVEDEEFIAGGGKGTAKVGGKVDGDTLTWDSNIEHMIKVTNTSGSSSDIFIKMLFNEV